MENKKYFLFLALAILFGCFLAFPHNAKAAPEITVYNIITNDTTPDIKGTITGVTGVAGVSVTISEIGTYSLDSVTDGDWSITFASALESGYYYTAEVTATDEAGEDSASAFVYVDEECPYEFYYTSVGDEAAFSSVTFSEEYSYDSEDGNFSLLFPAGTAVTKTGGGTFDIAEWYAETAEPNNERIILKLRFGVPDIDLTFSENVTVTFHVGTEYNGETLNIFSRGDGDNDEGWESLETSCTVSGGSCSFNISHASYFAITQYTSIAETEEGENDDDDDDEDDDSQKAKITSWKAYQYENNNGVSCPDKLVLEIKGNHFNKDAEVKIGSKKAYSVDKKSGKKIVAKFCMSDLLKVNTGKRRTISVTNPDADKEKAAKKINLNNISYKKFIANDFNLQTTEGTENIQKALISLGFLDKQYITGFYGPLTEKAILEFQRQSGISQTGYVGPLTKAKLEKELE